MTSLWRGCFRATAVCTIVMRAESAQRIDAREANYERMHSGAEFDVMHKTRLDGIIINCFSEHVDGSARDGASEQFTQCVGTSDSGQRVLFRSKNQVLDFCLRQFGPTEGVCERTGRWPARKPYGQILGCCATAVSDRHQECLLHHTVLLRRPLEPHISKEHSRSLASFIGASRIFGLPPAGFGCLPRPKGTSARDAGSHGGEEETSFSQAELPLPIRCSEARCCSSEGYGEPTGAL